MVEDVALNKAILHLAEVSDQIFFADVKAGYALIDSGARRVDVVESDFRFGDGATLVECGLWTPPLLARRVLKRWQDFAAGKIKMMDQAEWTTPLRTSDGHYLIDLLPAGGKQVFYEDATEDLYTDTPMIIGLDDLSGDTCYDNMSIDKSEVDAIKRAWRML